MRDLRVLCTALLMLWLCFGGPVVAGVVEDAEQALSSIPSDNPEGKRRLGGEGEDSPFSPGSRSIHQVRASGNSTAASTRSRSSRTKATSETSGAASAPVGMKEASDSAPDEANELRRARDKADNLTTSFSLLVLFLLIAAAGLYSRRSGRDD